MIKLYNINDFESRYWEAWIHEGRIVYHEGVLGERGEKREVPIPPGQSAEAIMEREAHGPRTDGFVELDEDDLAELVIQYRVHGWGSGKDLDRRHRVEDLMKHELGWTGLGHCDGGDIGSGTLNIYCYVVDPNLAVKVAVEALRKEELLGGALIATQSDQDYVVLWPENHSGRFELL